MTNLAIIGSSGSIGLKAAEIARSNKDKYRVVSLSVKRNFDVLLKQIIEFSPLVAAIEELDNYEFVKHLIPKTTQLICGKGAVNAACCHESVDTVVFFASGFEPLGALLEAVKLKKRIALANKESIVCAGKLIKDLALKSKSKIIPVDSEHSAIYQCLLGVPHSSVKRLILTASGGAFFGLNSQQLNSVSVGDALKHPTYAMGKKITIDSATMANKGLEIIEAHHLFDIPIGSIDYIIHRESIIHSMVELADNSILAQMSYPDMELPIRYALEESHNPSNIKSLDFVALKQLTFFAPDEQSFPMPRLAKLAALEGGTSPTVFNAANEVAVEMFCAGKISFNDIFTQVERALVGIRSIKNPTLEDIYYINKETREYLIKGFAR